MAIAEIRIPVDEQLAREYASLSPSEQQRFREWIEVWLSSLRTAGTGSLSESMDRASEEARKNGLTPEILADILGVPVDELGL